MYMRVCTYARVYVCACGRMGVFTYVRVYVCACVRMPVWTYGRIYVCTCVRMRAHAHCQITLHSLMAVFADLRLTVCSLKDTSSDRSIHRLTSRQISG